MCYRIIGFAQVSISIDIDVENIEFFEFSENRCYAAIETSSSYQITTLDLRKFEFITAVPIEGLIADSG